MKIDLRKCTMIDILVLLTGICSTFQITKIFGVTWFTLFLFLVSIILGIQKPKIKIIKNNKYPIYYFLFATLSELMIFTISLSNKSEWISSSIRKYVLLVALVVFFYKIVQHKKVDIFLKGIYISCIIEMIWCYLQFILHFKGIMINKILWDLSEISSQGHLMLCGLNTIAGILVPSIAFLFYFSKNTLIKIMSFCLFFLAGNTTMLISGLTILFFKMIIYLKQIKRKNKIKKSKILIMVLCCAVVVFILSIVGYADKILEVITNLMSRVQSVRTNNYLDGSTYTHARYYTSVIHIFANTKILNILFGYGIGCSGVPFVQIFNQYPDLVYIPESDFISYLYDFGLVGVILVYFIFFRIVLLSYKKRKEDILGFMITVLLSGIFYGMQLNWVILLEWIFLAELKLGANTEFVMGKFEINKQRIFKE